MQELKTAMTEFRRDKSSADETAKSKRADIADAIGAAADRLEMLNERFAKCRGTAEPAGNGNSRPARGASIAFTLQSLYSPVGGLRGALGAHSPGPIRSYGS